MTPLQMLIAQLASTVVALALVLVSWRRPNAGRLLFALLFAWAFQVDLRTALLRPHLYLEYAPLAVSELYRGFILGFFARHITAIVAAIALGQLAIAVLVTLRGRAVRLGLAGAIVFLLAIAPLGQGAGFPATIIIAGAAALLARRPFERSLPAEAAGHWRGRRRARG